MFLQITYEAVGPVQMNFLRLLSQNGYQNFTYTCINSAAWFNAKTNSHDMAVKFMGENSVQFSSEPGSPKVDVLVDGCKVRPSFGFYFIGACPAFATFALHVPHASYRSRSRSRFLTILNGPPPGGQCFRKHLNVPRARLFE